MSYLSFECPRILRRLIFSACCVIRSLLTYLIAVCAVSVGSEAQEPGKAVATPPRQAVTINAGDDELRGILFRPQGDGPFPALIWNHGSEKAPGATPEFESIASIFVPAGYVVFAPVRRGHGFSKGQYIVDVYQQTWKSRGAEAANRLVVQLLETEQLDDQLAGLAYTKQLAFVDTNRIAVAGCSYGGIETLLGAERNVGYKAAISISPAGLSWDRNPFLQKRLLQSVRGINIPVLLLQPLKISVCNRAGSLERRRSASVSSLRSRSTPTRGLRLKEVTALGAPKETISGQTMPRHFSPPICISVQSYPIQKCFWAARSSPGWCSSAAMACGSP